MQLPNDPVDREPPTAQFALDLEMKARVPARELRHTNKTCLGMSEGGGERWQMNMLRSSSYGGWTQLAEAPEKPERFASYSTAYACLRWPGTTKSSLR